MPEIPMNNSRRYSCWAQISPAEDVPGEWVAHCLNLDVASQGSTPEHASQMIREACAMVVEEDLRSGIDPLSHEAPVDEWDAFHVLRERAQHMPIADIAAQGKTMLLPFDVVALGRPQGDGTMWVAEMLVGLHRNRDGVTQAA